MKKNEPDLKKPFAGVNSDDQGSAKTFPEMDVRLKFRTDGTIEGYAIKDGHEGPLTEDITNRLIAIYVEQQVFGLAGKTGSSPEAAGQQGAKKIIVVVDDSLTKRL